ncbi:MAG TPA: hypothetical protein VMS71_00210, partial [Candidatus Acidoferrum sp.]|nr:hypothetical protein [Candidatus Acidoferrum sp.]
DAQVLAANRPHYENIALAYPIRQTYLPKPQEMSKTSIEHILVANLTVDTLGCVADAIPENPADSDLVRISLPLLKAFDFVPGMVGSTYVTQILPVSLDFAPANYFPTVQFPIDSAGDIRNGALYSRALSQNGVTLPAIERFPSIFATVHATDTPLVYQHVLVSLDLDSTGHPVVITPAQTNCAAFTLQMLSAANWASYSPLRLDGVPRGSRNFLLISLFPGLNFPTRPWPPNPPLAFIRYQRLMFQVLADTVGLMAPPIPKQALDGTFTFSGPEPPRTDSLSVLVQIDTLGRATAVRVYPQRRRTFALALTKQLHFYPGLDYSGRPQPFLGLVTASALNATEIRVQYSWLR